MQINQNVSHILRASWNIFRMFLASVFLTIIGIPIVAYALTKRVTYPETSQKFTQYATDEDWVMVRFPESMKWAKWWDHVIDGFAGDTRGWWHTHAPFKGGAYQYWNMFWWGAIRNGVNYWKRFVVSIPVDEYRIFKIAGTHDEINTNDHSKLVGNGKFGWSFLCAQHKTSSRQRHHFGLILPWTKAKFDDEGNCTKPGRCLSIQLGWKVKISHMKEDFSGEKEYKKWKGYHFVILPAKQYT